MSKRKSTIGATADQPLLSFKRVKKGAEAGAAEGVEESSLTSTSTPQTTRERVPLDQFEQLLDFSQLARREDVQTRFDTLANALIHDVVLVVRKQEEEGQEEAKEVEFQVLEAEFYLQIQDIHEDPFTHGSEEQKVAGRWYFHRAPRRSEDSHRSATSTTMYRGGSRKGLDLTIAAPPAGLVEQNASTSTSTTPSDKERLLRGGILLRSVRRLGKGGKVTSGPSLLVDQVLAASGTDEIETLVNDFWGGDISAFLSTSRTEAGQSAKKTTFFIRSRLTETQTKTPVFPPIYFSPRIGLDLSHPGTTPTSKLPLHPRITFLARRYRFFIYPTELTANGRAHTFVGLLLTLLLDDLSSKPTFQQDPQGAIDSVLVASSSSQPQRRKLLAEIVKLGGFQPATAERYLDDFVEGRKGGGRGTLDGLVGLKGKGASSAPRTCLKMFGALSAFVPGEMGIGAVDSGDSASQGKSGDGAGGGRSGDE